MDFTAFTLLTEAKMYKLSEFYISQVRQLAHRFYMYYLHDKTPQERSITLRMQSKRRIYIGEIDIKPEDRKLLPDRRYKERPTLPIYISLLSDETGGHFLDGKYIVEINKKHLGYVTENDIFETIVHELAHAVKINHFVHISKKYTRAVDNIDKDLPYNEEDYLFEPLEMEARLTGIYHYIIKRYNELQLLYKYKMNRPEQWRSVRERYIKNVETFVYTPFDKFIKNPNALPQQFLKYDHFFAVLYRNKQLWNKFKLKMLDLLKDLKEMKQFEIEEDIDRRKYRN